MTAFASTTNMKLESKNTGILADVLNCENNVAGGSGQSQSEDATASSSSFGNTFSDNEPDNEVMSGLRVDPAPMHGLRKKKVTSRWRKFIQPIMWRCKWLELQVRKFESMAVMYDNELEKHSKIKELKYKSFELEEGCAKSMPFVHDSKRRKLMKRKIREKHEDSDTNMSMLQQIISSYLATRGSPSNSPTMDVDETRIPLAGLSSPKTTCNEFKVLDELEQILWKIEVSQSRVCKMKDRLDVVMSENNGRILATENNENNGLTQPVREPDIVTDVEYRKLLTQPVREPDILTDVEHCKLLTQPVREPDKLTDVEYRKLLTQPVKEPDFLTDVDGPSILATFASQLMKLSARHDVIKRENAAFEFTDVQDANEPAEQPCFASIKQSTDSGAKKQQTDSGAVNIHPTEKLQVPEEENNTISEDSSQNDQPAPKTRSISKLTTPTKTNKRRVGRPRRKTGPSVWNRKTSG